MDQKAAEDSREGPQDNNQVIKEEEIASNCDERNVERCLLLKHEIIVTEDLSSKCDQSNMDNEERTATMKSTIPKQISSDDSSAAAITEERVLETSNGNALSDAFVTPSNSANGASQIAGAAAAEDRAQETSGGILHPDALATPSDSENGTFQITDGTQRMNLNEAACVPEQIDEARGAARELERLHNDGAPQNEEHNPVEEQRPDENDRLIRQEGAHEANRADDGAPQPVEEQRPDEIDRPIRQEGAHEADRADDGEPHPEVIRQPQNVEVNALPDHEEQDANETNHRILRRFPSVTEFEKFSRSYRGLKLPENVISLCEVKNPTEKMEHLLRQWSDVHDVKPHEYCAKLGNIVRDYFANRGHFNEEQILQRHEDTFQEIIIPRFSSITHFNKFARSAKGLKVPDTTISDLTKDHTKDSFRYKMEVLKHWRMCNDEAPPCKIVELVTSFLAWNRR